MAKARVNDAPAQVPNRRADTQAWYRAYLATPAWRKIRAAKLAATGEQCERCPTYGKRGPDGVVLGLHVHHRNYERCPGNERLDDLEVLCIVCHQVEHGLSEDTPTARENAAIAASRRMADIVLAPLTAAAAEEERDGLA